MLMHVTATFLVSSFSQGPLLHIIAYPFCRLISRQRKSKKKTPAYAPAILHLNEPVYNVIFSVNESEVIS